MQIAESFALKHLDRMTDSTGLIQHAIFSIPRQESGYTTDDNARALRLCVRLWDQQPEEQMLKRVTTYLSFLEYGRGIGRGFHNFLGYDHRWLDAEGCGDCQGQAVRSLAEVLGSSLPATTGAGPRVDRHRSADACRSAQPPRSSVCDPGVGTSVECGSGRHRTAGNRGLVGGAATRGMLRPCRAAGLAVVRVAYDLCQRGVAARAVHRRPALAEGGIPGDTQASFAFLDRQTTIEGVFWPVGNEGWHPRGEEKASYDQQPVEAATMAEAALSAFDLLGADEYLATFRRAHGWFHGHNSLKRSLVDIRSGACCDGLQASGVNRNQGAELTLAYLWAEMSNTEILHLHGDNPRVALPASEIA